MNHQNPIKQQRRSRAVGAVALTCGLFSASQASSQIIAGWDTWDSVTAPTVSVVTPGITASVAVSGTGGNWTNLDNGSDPGRGSSSDGTWGSYSEGIAASGVTDVGAANLTLTNGKTDGEFVFTLTNDSTSDIDLSAFHMDAMGFRPNAARTYSLEVLADSDITIGVVFESESLAINHLAGNLSEHDQHDDIDIDLAQLADSTLAVGETATIKLAFSEGTGSGGGHHLFVDNMAFTAVSDVTDRLAVTSVPAAAVAGTDFPITVEAQDENGAPINVVADTEVVLSSSGVGTLTGATGTILAGTSSITLPAVQGTVAETISVNASRVSGDEILSSVLSTTFDIIAADASSLTVESAADGSGAVIGDTLVIIGDNLDAFAISRDSFGNFVANEALAAFTLTEITGEVVAADLLDNADGSANFLANLTGTAKISANVTSALTGFDATAETGVLTVEPLVNRYDGGTNSSPNLNTPIVWQGNVLPLDSNTTDLFFFDNNTITKRNSYLGRDTLVRSLSVDSDTGGNFLVSFVLQGNATPASLTIDTDSETEPAEINVTADVVSNFTLGRAGFINEGDQGDLILADNLLVTHDGTANLIINTSIVEDGGSYGITKAGTGTLDLSGNNSYTGDTTVNAGVLRVNGFSIPDEANLVVDGGVVDVAADERVAGLTLGGTAQPEGVYGSSASAAPVPDDVNFSGTGTITVGPPLGPIEVTNIAMTGENEITLTYNSSGPVDIYGSIENDGFIWSLFETDETSGTYVDIFASTPKTFYVLVPAGAPAPADSPQAP